MPRQRPSRCALAALAGLAFGTGAVPASGQAWGVAETEGAGGASAYVCPVDDATSGNVLCFRLGCSDAEPLHFSLELAGGGSVDDPLPVRLHVDGATAGALDFSPIGADPLELTAPFDPRLHADLLRRLALGNEAVLTLGWANGEVDVPMSLAGSSASLDAVTATCPQPTPPVGDPASAALGEVVKACQQLGGNVALEPGFERHEDLDGDGSDDVVVDYAAAVCSERATLFCGSGGCTVGFFLARGDGYRRILTEVIRGYDVLPGGKLALDLHGSACGLYGFEACREVFDIAGDAPVMIEQLAGAAAEAAMQVVAADTAVDETIVDETAATETAVIETAALADAAVAPGAAATRSDAGDRSATAPAEVLGAVPDGSGNAAPAPAAPAPAAATIPSRPVESPDIGTDAGSGVGTADRSDGSRGESDAAAAVRTAVLAAPGAVSRHARVVAAPAVAIASAPAPIARLGAGASKGPARANTSAPAAPAAPAAAATSGEAQIAAGGPQVTAPAIPTPAPVSARRGAAPGPASAPRGAAPAPVTAAPGGAAPVVLAAASLRHRAARGAQRPVAAPGSEAAASSGTE